VRLDGNEDLEYLLGLGIEFRIAFAMSLSSDSSRGDSVPPVYLFSGLLRVRANGVVG